MVYFGRGDEPGDPIQLNMAHLVDEPPTETELSEWAAESNLLDDEGQLKPGFSVGLEGLSFVEEVTRGNERARRLGEGVTLLAFQYAGHGDEADLVPVVRDVVQAFDNRYPDAPKISVVGIAKLVERGDIDSPWKPHLEDTLRRASGTGWKAQLETHSDQPSRVLLARAGAPEHVEAIDKILPALEAYDPATRRLSPGYRVAVEKWPSSHLQDIVAAYPDLTPVFAAAREAGKSITYIDFQGYLGYDVLEAVAVLTGTLDGAQAYWDRMNTNPVARLGWNLWYTAKTALEARRQRRQLDK